MSTHIAELQAELDGVRRRIRALEVAVECARILAAREHRISNFGWFLSIVFGGVGTVVAVTRSQREDMYVDELHGLEMELVKLWIDKKILLRDISHAQRLRAIEAAERRPAMSP